ncbi:MAG: preprotein translocase subunit YajC [Clostridia bacterium]|nr:preprotein translocase subunit YajC [Clostridia bacterium]
MASTTDPDGGTPSGGCSEMSMIPMLIILGVIFVGFFIFTIINNKRNKKKVESQRSNLSIGDTIETVGGIIGVVKEIRDLGDRKDLIVQTGTEENPTILTVDVQALYRVIVGTNMPVDPSVNSGEVK